MNKPPIYLLSQFRLRTILYSFSLILLSLFSCESKRIDNSQLIGQDEFGLHRIDTCDYDTAQYLSSLNIREEFSQFDVLNDDSTDYYNKRIDTVELRQIAYACLCPSWIRTDSLAIRENCDPHYSGYYLRPANKDSAIPDILSGFTTIQVIGRISKKMYNLDLYSTGKAPSYSFEPGYEFKYYTYKVLKPYYVLGPKTCKYDESEDTIIYTRNSIEIN